MKLPINLNPNVAPQTVSVYTRHSAGCAKRGSTPGQKAAARYERRCNCPKWIYLFHDGKDYRFSAGTRSWQSAEQKKQEIERELDPVRAELRSLKKEREARRVTVADAVNSYLLDAEARKLGSQTLAKRRAVFERQLVPWANAKGIRSLDELTVTLLTEWRTTWKLAPITTRNRQELLGNFFRFCVRQGWLKDNPALLLSKIQVKQRPTGYFTPEEFELLLKSTYSFAAGQSFRAEDWSVRLRTLVLLMRWSGLRIGDAVTLERSRLQGNRIFLYQAKTGVPVYVPLPPDVAEALRNAPPGREPNPRFFFWSGKGKPERAGSVWRPAFRRLFEIAALKDADGTPKQCKPHMLRDTFAVEMLLAEIPIEEVSMLLGHTSIKTTQKHYAPWVRARQEKLEQSVQRAWRIQGIAGDVENVSTAFKDGANVQFSSRPEFDGRHETVPNGPHRTLNLVVDAAAPVPQARKSNGIAALETQAHTVESSSSGRKDATGGQRQRRRFPCAEVARMWDEGKTVKEIATAIGRLDKGEDPTHTMRNFLRRMHRVGYKDPAGVASSFHIEVVQVSVQPLINVQCFVQSSYDWLLAPEMCSRMSGLRYIQQVGLELAPYAENT